MAEVFGVLAGVISVIDVGARVSGELVSLCTAWRNAPLDILLLSNEVTDLNVILQLTSDACEETKSSLTKPAFSDALENHVQQAHALLKEIDQALSPLIPMRKLKKRTKWIHLKRQLMLKRIELKVVRGRIRDVLQAFDM